MPFWAVVILFVTVGGVLALVGALVFFRARQRRACTLLAFARDAGLEFSARPPLAGAPECDRRRYADPRDAALLGFLEPCPFTRHWTSMSARNILQGGPAGERWMILDVSAWQQAGPMADCEAVQCTVVALLRPSHPAGLSVEPRLPGLSRLAVGHAGRPPVLTGDPAFDARFVVRAGDAGVPATVLPAQVRQFLVDLHQHPSRWYRHLCILDDSLVLCEATPAPVERVRDMMEILRGLSARLSPAAPGGPNSTDTVRI